MQFVNKLTAALILISVGSSPLAAADVQIIAQNPVIELSVSEQVDSRPDTATFSTGVQTKARTATQALRENSRRARIIIEKLKGLGIAERDIQTTGISLNANYEYDRENKQNRFVGYRVSNQVRAKVRDIDKLGKILDALVSSGGATNLNGPYFSISDDSSVKKIARERALNNARSQAESYAKLSGYSGVRILSISEAIRGVSQVRAQSSRMMMSEAESVPIAPGQVGTAVLLNITYEMVR